MTITSKNFNYLQFLAAIIVSDKDTPLDLKVDLIKKYQLPYDIYLY